MTREEFDNQKFGKGDKAKYKDGNIYDVATVDFDERLIGLLMKIPGGDSDEISYVRCENVEYIPAATPPSEINWVEIGKDDYKAEVGEYVLRVTTGWLTKSWLYWISNKDKIVYCGNKILTKSMAITICENAYLKHKQSNL